MARLRYENRVIIEYMLNNKKKCKEICEKLNIDRSTLYREIKRNSIECSNNKKVKVYGTCDSLSVFPYCCNACYRYDDCHLVKKIYKAPKAQLINNRRIKKAHTGALNLTQEEFKALDDLLYEQIVLKGQSIHMICAAHQELKIGERQIYNLIGANKLRVKKIDLRRTVQRKRKGTRRDTKPKTQNIIEGRTFSDFKDFMRGKEDKIVVEIDTIKSNDKDAPCLLTLFFRKLKFHMVFVIPTCSINGVDFAFNYIKSKLSDDEFFKLFEIMLPDNGTEFNDLSKYEIDINGERRGRVFYTRPYRSNDKAGNEKNNEIARYIAERDINFKELIFDDGFIITNSINSFCKKVINDFTPYELFSMKYGSKYLDLLGFNSISKDKVILKKHVLSQYQNKK